MSHGQKKRFTPTFVTSGHACDRSSFSASAHREVSRSPRGLVALLGAFGRMPHAQQFWLSGGRPSVFTRHRCGSLDSVHYAPSRGQRWYAIWTQQKCDSNRKKTRTDSGALQCTARHRHSATDARADTAHIVITQPAQASRTAHHILPCLLDAPYRGLHPPPHPTAPRFSTPSSLVPPPPDSLPRGDCLLTLLTAAARGRRSGVSLGLWAAWVLFLAAGGGISRCLQRPRPAQSFWLRTQPHAASIPAGGASARVCARCRACSRGIRARRGLPVRRGAGGSCTWRWVSLRASPCFF